jgi:hypothetical protein
LCAVAESRTVHLGGLASVDLSSCFASRPVKKIRRLRRSADRVAGDSNADRGLRVLDDCSVPCLDISLNLSKSPCANDQDLILSVYPAISPIFIISAPILFHEYSSQITASLYFHPPL